MSNYELIDTLHELESYGLIAQTADDAEIADALAELALCDGGEDGE